MKKLEKLKRGFKTGLKGHKLVYTFIFTTLFYIFITLASFPQYSIQLLGNSVFYLDESIISLSQNTLDTSGILGLTLNVVYAFLSGVTITSIAETVRISGFSSTKEISILLPGMAAAGCASCGVGLLAFIGLGGALAAAPFKGNLIRIGGIVLLTAVIIRNGERDLCSIDGS